MSCSSVGVRAALPGAGIHPLGAPRRAVFSLQVQRKRSEFLARRSWTSTISRELSPCEIRARYFLAERQRPAAAAHVGCACSSRLGVCDPTRTAAHRTCSANERARPISLHRRGDRIADLVAHCRSARRRDAATFEPAAGEGFAHGGLRFAWPPHIAALGSSAHASVSSHAEAGERMTRTAA